MDDTEGEHDDDDEETGESSAEGSCDWCTLLLVAALVLTASATTGF